MRILNCTKPRLGNLIIANDCDRPELKMVALITHVDAAGVLYCKYLSDDEQFNTFNEKNGGLGFKTTIMDAQPLAEFGCAALLSSPQHLHVVQLFASSACYRDGEHRNWQGKDVDHMIIRDLITDIAIDRGDYCFPYSTQQN